MFYELFISHHAQHTSSYQQAHESFRFFDSINLSIYGITRALRDTFLCSCRFCAPADSEFHTWVIDAPASVRAFEILKKTEKGVNIKVVKNQFFIVLQRAS